MTKIDYEVLLVWHRERETETKGEREEKEELKR